MIPIWIAEGRKELSDDCIVWDWLKYNIRAHAVHFSQRKAKERNEKENNLQMNSIRQKEFLKTIQLI